ncbi:hypothetical protein F7725_008232 [Dissostichus mawsoni]|uniref:Uncharacterized protein n=1 Tax=Dissostichus mawsoni TaxID=36200 RepID=A0A7J5Y8J7_DISMA|nr:hypothetical protein F7725_008232 [Dissostichus mawsoni]
MRAGLERGDRLIQTLRRVSELLKLAAKSCDCEVADETVEQLHRNRDPQAPLNHIRASDEAPAEVEAVRAQEHRPAGRSKLQEVLVRRLVLQMELSRSYSDKEFQHTVHHFVKSVSPHRPLLSSPGRCCSRGSRDSLGP